MLNNYYSFFFSQQKCANFLKSPKSPKSFTLCLPLQITRSHLFSQMDCRPIVNVIVSAWVHCVVLCDYSVTHTDSTIWCCYSVTHTDNIECFFQCYTHRMYTVLFQCYTHRQYRVLFQCYTHRQYRVLFQCYTHRYYRVLLQCYTHRQYRPYITSLHFSIIGEN